METIRNYKSDEVLKKMLSLAIKTDGQSDVADRKELLFQTAGVAERAPSIKPHRSEILDNVHAAGALIEANRLLSESQPITQAVLGAVGSVKSLHGECEAAVDTVLQWPEALGNFVKSMGGDVHRRIEDALTLLLI